MEKKKEVCKVCGATLKTNEEKEYKWCTKHLDEFEEMCSR